MVQRNECHHPVTTLQKQQDKTPLDLFPRVFLEGNCKIRSSISSTFMPHQALTTQYNFSVSQNKCLAFPLADPEGKGKGQMKHVLFSFGPKVESVK